MMIIKIRERNRMFHTMDSPISHITDDTIIYPPDNDRFICVISGGSGSGKTTALLKLDQSTVDGKTISVMPSRTTRKLRQAGEPFRISISKEEFCACSPAMVQKIHFGEHSYGILTSDVEEGLSKGFVLVDCIAQGIHQLRKSRYCVKAVFLYAKPQVLLSRLLARKTTPEDVKFRMEESAEQLREALSSGLYQVFIDTAAHGIDTTETMIRSFLAGHPVVSDCVDHETYLAELQAVMAEWEKGRGASHV